jgi:AcrR family transcriptional regulator
MTRLPAKNTKTAKRRPGRPVGEDHAPAIRSALITAARELFARRGYKAISVREIAAKACVNPAMIHYHFGDKDGLYRAMLQETINPVLQKVHKLTTQAGRQPEASLHNALEALITTLAREPWVAQLVVHEVLAGEGPFRDMFIREFASKGGGRLPRLIKNEQAAGRIKKDFDPTLGALSILGMALFPFIALPVVEKVFRVKMTAPFAQHLIEHTVRLFYSGAASAGKGG